MNDLKLQGQSGFFPKEIAPQQRKLKDGVSLEQLKMAGQDNNLDELVVKDKTGQQYVIYADELTVQDGNLPRVNDKVNLPFLDEPATVVHVDNEWNEDLGYAAASIALGLRADQYEDGVGTEGNETKLHNLTEKISNKPTERELKWANQQWEQMLEKDFSDPNILRSYKPIFDKATAIQMRQEIYELTNMPLVAPTESQMKWAATLQDQIQKGYQPSENEQEKLDLIIKRFMEAEKAGLISVTE